MDFETYRRKYFVEPTPQPRFAYRGLLGITLYFEAYEQATHFYTQVLGPPAYVEGSGTRGWQLGSTWLTLLRGREGQPRNVEVSLVMSTPAEAERLQEAFIAAGGTGQPAADGLMYAPVRMCPVTDPFGTEILIYSPLEA